MYPQTYTFYPAVSGKIDKRALQYCSLMLMRSIFVIQCNTDCCKATYVHKDDAIESHMLV